MQIIAVGAGRGKDVRLPGPPSPLLPTISTCFNANSVAQPFSDRNPHVPPLSRRQRAACLGHRGVGLDRPTGRRPQPSPCPPERLRGYDSRIVRLAAAYARDSPAGRIPQPGHPPVLRIVADRPAIRVTAYPARHDPSHGLTRCAGRAQSIHGYYGPAGTPGTTCPANFYCPAGSEDPVPCPAGTVSLSQVRREGGREGPRPAAYEGGTRKYEGGGVGGE